MCSHLQCTFFLPEFMALYSFEFCVNCQTTFCGSRQRKISSSDFYRKIVKTVIGTQNFKLAGTAKSCLTVGTIYLNCKVT
jgi:hypothetical protein